MAPSREAKIKLSLLVLHLTESIMKKRKSRKLWSKPWLLDRENVSQINILRELNSCDLKNLLRMNSECFYQLLSMVRPFIQKKNTLMRKAVSAEERLIVTLRFLATGRSYEDLKFSAGISSQLISQIIPETCRAISSCLKQYIKMPSSEEEWKAEASKFEMKWKFSHCLGAMDGIHYQIIKPPKSGSLFYNYKKFFSIVMFAIVNANYEFLYVHVGTPGSVSDANILANTDFYNNLLNNELNLPSPSSLPGTDTLAPYVFVGDSAFSLNTNVMKPHPLENITHEKRIFNYRLSRARRVVENAFGILASRFHVLNQTLSVNLDNVQHIVFACCALHNFLSQKSSEYLTEFSVDSEDTNNFSFRPGDWRQTNPPSVPLARNTNRQRNEEGDSIRNVFTNFFNNEGRVSFQDQMLNVITDQ